jgi:hypothetical protein
MLVVVVEVHHFVDVLQNSGEFARPKVGNAGTCVPQNQQVDITGRLRNVQGLVRPREGVVHDGPAEIRQDAITHAVSDKPIVADDHVAAEGSIRMQEATQVFGPSFSFSAVEPTRSQNITVSWRRSPPNRIFGSQRGRRRLFRGPHSRNRLKEFFAVAQGHAELSKVALRQLR